MSAPDLIAPSLDKLLDQELDAIINDFTHAAGIPGLSLVLHQHVTPSKPATSAFKSYGVAYGDQAVTPQMRFPLCSITKHFSALALVRLLYEQGMTEDTPVRTVLPEFRLSNEIDGVVVTFGHLLSHSTGMETNNGFWLEILTTGVSVYDYLAKQPCAHAPGAQFSYANVIYDLCVPAIEKLSGESYELYLKKVFFAPLGMSSTSFEGEGGVDAAEGHYRDDSKDEASGRQAVLLPFGKAFGFQGLPSRLAWRGSVMLISSAEDMAKWLAYLPTDPYYHTIATPRIPASDTARPGSAINDSGEQYGLGLFIGSSKGISRIEHWAAVPGFSGLLTHFPTLGLSVVSLCNSWEGREVGSMITGVIISRILGEDPSHVVKSMTLERTDRVQHDKTDSAPVSGRQPTKSTHIIGTYDGAGVSKLVFDEASNVQFRPKCSFGSWLPFLQGDIKPVVAHLGEGKYAGCLRFTQWRREGDAGPARVVYCQPFRLERVDGGETLSVSASYFSPAYILRRA